MAFSFNLHHLKHVNYHKQHDLYGISFTSSECRENFAAVELQLQRFCTTEYLLYITGMNVINTNNLIVGLR